MKLEVDPHTPFFSLQNWAFWGQFFAIQSLFINLKGKNTDRVMSVMTLWCKLWRHYQAAGLPQGYSGAHLLRHTAATGMYRRSKDLLGVARILGHASPSTTSIYAKVDQSELRRMVEG